MYDAKSGAKLVTPGYSDDMVVSLLVGEAQQKLNWRYLCRWQLRAITVVETDNRMASARASYAKRLKASRQNETVQGRANSTRSTLMDQMSL